MASALRFQGSLDVRLSGERELVISRDFDAPRPLVFDCFTKPELVKRWLLGPPGWSMPVCDIDLRVDGKYRYTWRNEETKHEFSVAGVFKEIARPDRIVHSELFDEDWTGGETLVTSLFIEAGGTTTVAMTIRYASADSREKALATGMTRGMTQSYDRLAEMLDTLPAA